MNNKNDLEERRQEILEDLGLEDLDLGEVGESLASGFGKLTAGLKSRANSAVNKAKQFSDQASSKDLMNHIETKKDEDLFAKKHFEQTAPNKLQSNNGAKFCSNCGNKIVVGAKFCSSCGSPVNAPAVAIPPIPGVAMANFENQRSRQEKTVQKCLNCGATVGYFDGTCPECGYHIPKRAIVSSVQEFNEQMMMIESTRNSKTNPFLEALGVRDSTDQKVLSLIRNYPIPNTINDITEFMILAIGNIDVNLSKYTKYKQLNSEHSSAAESISDAWVSKMEQAYKKAKIVFPDEPEFEYVKKLYLEKMRELNLPVKL